MSLEIMVESGTAGVASAVLNPNQPLLDRSERMASPTLKQKPVIIYGLVDPITNEMGYVGQTTRTLGDRLRSHIHRALVERPSLRVSQWIAKIVAAGVRPEIVALEVVPVGHDWREPERFWIASMTAMGCRLSNMTDGGDIGSLMSADSRERLSRSMTGKPVTAEARAKISAANKGRKLTPEQIERRAAAQRGAKRSAEFAALCAERQRSRKGTYSLSEDACAKASERFSGEGNPFYGKKHSDQAKRLMAEANHARNRP